MGTGETAWKHQEKMAVSQCRVAGKFMSDGSSGGESHGDSVGTASSVKATGVGFPRRPRCQEPSYFIQLYP